MSGMPQQQPRQEPVKHKVVSWLINQILNVANRQVNIRELQQKYNAQEGRVLQMKIVDINRTWYFRVMEGRIDVLANPKDIAGGFETNSDTVICLATGKRKRMHPGTREVVLQDYTPFDALTHGDIRIWGEAATNDALLFAKAMRDQVYPTVKEKMAKHSMP